MLSFFLFFSFSLSIFSIFSLRQKKLMKKKFPPYFRLLLKLSLFSMYTFCYIYIFPICLRMSRINNHIFQVSFSKSIDSSTPQLLLISLHFLVFVEVVVVVVVFFCYSSPNILSNYGSFRDIFFPLRDWSWSWSWSWNWNWNNLITIISFSLFFFFSSLRYVE